MIIENDSQQRLLDYLLRTYFIDNTRVLSDGTTWYTISVNTFNKTNIEEWIKEQDAAMWTLHGPNSESNPFSFTVAYELHEQLYMLFVMKFPV